MKASEGSRWARLFGGFVCRGEDVWLARIALAFNASNDPISGAHNMSAFLGVDPSMNVHRFLAMIARSSSGNIGTTKVPHYAALIVFFHEEGTRLHAKRTILHVGAIFCVIVGVIAVFEPLGRFDNHGLLSELH
jgi:hypothetical protein